MYKLIGPTLIRQDPVEAKSNVQKRLDFITSELDRLDSQLRTHESKAEKRQQQVRTHACACGCACVVEGCNASAHSPSRSTQLQERG